MNKNKWKEIYTEEFDEANDKIADILQGDDIEPETWTEVREVILEQVKAVDEATEVYNMENEVGSK